MTRLTENQHARIVELCRRFAVRRLELVGSAARDDFRESGSDVDLLVEFVDDGEGPGLSSYFALKGELEALLERPVDLVMADAVTNPYVRADLARDRMTLYAA